MISQSEVSLSACMKGLVHRGYNPNVILDIGAATGSWTRETIRYFPKSFFYMFEPLSERKQDLVDTKNSYIDNVDYFLMALSDKIGTVDLGVNEKNLYCSSIMFKGSELRPVPVDTLDHLLDTEKIKQPDFIKVDVQGAQLLVLGGGERVLKNTELVLLEIPFFKFSPSHSILHEYIQWMDERGFIPYEIVDVLRRPLDCAMGQCDILFCKKEHFLLSDLRWDSPKNSKNFLVSKNTKIENSDIKNAYLRASELVKNNKLEQAVDTYKTILLKEPRSKIALAKVGELLFKCGKTVDAELYLKKAIEVNPDYWTYYFYGRVLEMNGKYNESKDAFLRAINKNKNIAWAYLGVADILVKKQEVSEATHYYNNAIEYGEGKVYFYERLLKHLVLVGDSVRVNFLYSSLLMKFPDRKNIFDKII